MSPPPPWPNPASRGSRPSPPGARQGPGAPAPPGRPGSRLAGRPATRGWRLRHGAASCSRRNLKASRYPNSTAIMVRKQPRPAYLTDSFPYLSNRRALPLWECCLEGGTSGDESRPGDTGESARAWDAVALTVGRPSVLVGGTRPAWHRGRAHPRRLGGPVVRGRTHAPAGVGAGRPGHHLPRRRRGRRRHQARRDRRGAPLHRRGTISRRAGFVEPGEKTDYEPVTQWELVRDGVENYLKVFGRPALASHHEEMDWLSSRAFRARSSSSRQATSRTAIQSSGSTFLPAVRATSRIGCCGCP